MIRRILCLPGAAVFGLLGVLLMQVGVERIETLRRIERIPRTSIGALIPGEANISGTARTDAGGTLQAPDSKRSTLYYAYTLERLERDSEGETRWNTIRSETRSVPFRIEDGTGSVRVDPEECGTVTPRHLHTRRDGDLRHSERRIDPGMTVFAVGIAVRRNADLDLSFTEPGVYVPLLSTATEEAERGGFGLTSLVLTVIGLLCLSLGMRCLTRVAGIHQTLTFLVLTALTVAVSLAWLSARMIRSDLTSAFQRLDREQTVRTEEVRRHLQGAGMHWAGEWNDPALRPDAPPLARAPGSVRDTVSMHRVNLARSVLRAERIRQRFPERFFAASMGLAAPETLNLTDAEMEQLAALETQFRPSRISGRAAAVMGGVGLAGALLLGGLGMRRIRIKRWIENIPTVKTRGVVYGINEVKGEVAMPEGASALTGPLSGQPCACYHYVVREKRRSGRKTEWVTLTNEWKRAPFLCRDSEGDLPVHPDGAELVLKARTRQRQGKREHTEHRLPIGVPVYVLGSAAVDPRTHDRLIIKRSDDRDLPYLISDYPEKELISRKAAAGFLILTFGLSFFMLAGFSLAGYRGGFDAVSYLSAALAPLVYFLLVMTSVLYNDLVYLRRRCDTLWSNIDVALKKRFDLLPQLAAVAARALEHERGLQERIALLRSSDAPLDPIRAGQMAAQETAALGQVVGLIEQYPELKTDRAMEILARTLRDVENEVGLMREGYNHAVEVYNTRIRRIPDLLLAGVFRFAPRSFFSQAGSEADTPPPVAFSDAPAG